MTKQTGRVVGLGGVFVKARDPQALSAFYRDQLGAPVQDWGGALFEYTDETGAKRQSLWNAFAADTDHFRPATKDYMINLRVDDLEAMLARLSAAGVALLDRREEGEFGRFAYLLDPEGTLVELWQPPAPPAPPA